MTTAQDLRIGNWVYPKEENRTPWQIKGVSETTLYFGSFNWGGRVDIHETASIEEVRPIPLNADLLINAGFKGLPHFTVQGSLMFDIGRGRVVSVGCVGTPNEMVFLTEEEAPKVNAVIVLRNFDYDGKTYLHHIQNIIFALTGQELEVKF